MTRKYLVLFAILFFCLFFLGSAVAGKGGFLYQRQLEELLDQQNDVLRKLELVDSNLKREEENIYTRDFLLDKSIKQGYSLESDEVYFFPPDNLEYDSEKLYDLRQIQFESTRLWYLSNLDLCLIALAVSAFLTSIIALLGKWRKNGIE